AWWDDIKTSFPISRTMDSKKCYSKPDDELLEIVEKYLSADVHSPDDLRSIILYYFVDPGLPLGDDTSTTKFADRLEGSRPFFVNFLERLHRGEFDFNGGEKGRMLQINWGERVLDFLDDVKKMRKLFKHKNLKVTDRDLINAVRFLEQKEDDEGKQEREELFKFFVDETIKKISQLGYISENSLAEEKIEVVKQILGLSEQRFQDREMRKFRANMSFNLGVVFDEYFDEKEKVHFVVVILNQYNTEVEDSVIQSWLEESADRKEAEEFEQNLGKKKEISFGNFDNLNGYEFEEYLKEVFKALGYKAIQTKLSQDQGADLVLLDQEGNKTVVQAKKYNGSVGNKAVQEIVAAKEYYKAKKAVVVITSTFTKSAIELANVNNVELWDRKKLNKVIKSISV
ncbi:MAG: restriction endonuclease, partial [Candidatus Omnitrophota bacterium]